MVTLPDTVLYWEMYGPATAVVFCGRRAEAGFRFTVTRDRATVLTGLAADSVSLFRHSRELRRRLEQAGFSTDADAVPPSTLDGGACWGPAAPLTGALVGCLSTADQ